MLISRLVIIILVSLTGSLNSRILLYNTENEHSIEKFDCVYYVYNNGEEIPYCRRAKGSQLLNRHRSKCENQGEKILFRNLLKENIDPNIIFKWISNIEILDFYASIFYNRSSIDDNNEQFICNCTKSGTFGKYCEYQLTHETKLFNETIKAQFTQKKTGDPWNTQRYGKILCYETLPYPYPLSPLCLDWREICDGVQRCTNGTDEENCDKLEFNECEENEFRCTNGMCIAEEFWLDGDYDCMDWSDELLLDDGKSCPYESNSIICDEHLCNRADYSCGDGQCIHWQNRMAFRWLDKTPEHCFNKRNINYMCEVSRNPISWTLANGLCWPEIGYDDVRYPPWHMIDRFNMTNEQKCDYLFRCTLSNGFERDCPCNQQNCSQVMMDNLCSIPSFTVRYPLPNLISSNYFIWYNYSQFMRSQLPSYFYLNGGIKCRGYFFYTNHNIGMKLTDTIFSTSLTNQALCRAEIKKYGIVVDSPPYSENKFCWNESVTFTGRPYAVNPDLCTTFAGECISQYRIRDGAIDCEDNDDEYMNLDKNYCTGNVGRHRFQCFDNQKKCIPTNHLGAKGPSCANQYDKTWYGTGIDIRSQIVCYNSQTTGCNRLKAYIQQSSLSNLTDDSFESYIKEQKQMNRMSFRDYCNSFWDMDNHEDEFASYCYHWICEPHQYRCRTGQCIELEWVCDGEWDCSDASDEEAIWINQPWSDHNIRLQNLNNSVKKCRERYSNSSFSKICNTSFEFGCYRSHVSNPLKIDDVSNRPCINLTQIGDGIEDCHNAYDERNTFVSNLYGKHMWGWYFRCDNNHITYSHACRQQRNCSHILCSSYRAENPSCSDLTDFVCLNESQCRQGIRCNGISECLHGEDEYWCPVGGPNDVLIYRFSKLQAVLRNVNLNLSASYPPIDTMESDQKQLAKPIVNHFQNTELFKKHSYQCNRGIAIIENTTIRCLCPPAYYGDFCEFFSDRISIIVRIDKTTKSSQILNSTLKIRSNFLFNNRIIDYHEFHSIPEIEQIQRMKYKFYLRYLHSTEMRIRKRQRYFNRTDIINHHPYAVHFDMFILEKNHNIKEIGSWHYPIYFDYLPAFRLAVVLKFPTWLENITLSPCREVNCNENSTCLTIFNQNHSSYCSCKSGYYGKNCSKYEPRCENYCSINALCRPDDSNSQTKTIKLHCICPLGYFGPRCHVKYDECNSNSCLNNGTCSPRYDPSGENPFLCICSDRFYGSHCQHDKASVLINLNMTKTLSIRATVIQFYNVYLMNRAMKLTIQNQQVYQGLPKFIELYHSNTEAPLMGLLKIYEDLTIHPRYFLVYLLQRRKINITSSPAYCPHASFLLSSGEFISLEKNDSVPLVFKYHKICANDTKQVCFHDEINFCLCQQYRAECFINDIEHDHCEQCLSGAKCLQGNLKDANDFICLCPFCHQGHRCEFNMQAFSFTLDSLFVNYSKTVKIIYVCIICLFFIVGLFNNICSISTFRRSIPRKVNVGTYLLMISYLNQMTLFCLLFKFIEITIGILGVGSCKIISYLLSVTTRSSYWLTSLITIDRLLMTIFPTLSFLKNIHISIGISLLTLTILLSMHIHEIIYYTRIQHHSNELYVCVTNFTTNLISTYNRIHTLIHHLCPFLIQIICVTIMIVLAARSRAKTTSKKTTFGQVLKKQFRTQKELYITPAIIILSALPQTIFTFSFACTQLRIWQQHILLISYLISNIPQVLGFILYVMPSSTYRKEFSETIIGKKLFQSTFNKTKR